MYVRRVDRTTFPVDWEEYERVVVRSTEDPDVIIGFRPGVWEQYARQFFRGTGDVDEPFEADEWLYEEVS